MTKALPYISKSKFLWGLQCPKLLWYAYNAKDEIPEPDAAQQAIFDQGHEVGALAKSLYPGGIEVGGDPSDLGAMLRRSLEAAKARKPLFEAGFTHNGGLARVDILDPVGRDEWDLIEVKSTTEVKDVHLSDVAFQRFVYSGAGLKIRRCCVMHINNEYVRHGEVDPHQFFTMVDVTKDVAVPSREIGTRLEEMFAVIACKQEPEVKVGPQCSDPYPCPLSGKCWSFLPDNSVFDLYRGGGKGWRLMGDGILRIEDIPDSFDLTERQEIQRKAVLTGKPRIDLTALASFLKRLKYPVSYLDFETYQTAIPLFDGLRPYQQVPFQFSLHRQSAPNTKPEHQGFLADGRIDPRQEFLDQLRDRIGNKGTIIVYNAVFEKRILNELAEAFPQHAGWIESATRRFIDLLEPFRNFDYYHPQQHGTASLKAVLPTLTGQSYDDLEIQEGGQAGREYLRVHFGDATEAERRKVRKQLERYCGQDTEGMIWIVEAITGICATTA